jgi:hypothetical protein
MPTEIFTVCALPHSCAAGADFHVSLFVSPKLTPDQPFDELHTFSLFPHWGAVVKQKVVVELFDQAGPIEATPLLGVLKPNVWNAAFPPETPVNGQPVPDWQQRRWRTFDARTVHDFGKAVHLATMYASPTAPPAPDDHPLAGPLAEISGRYYRTQHVADVARRRVYDESLMTEDFDQIVESAESPEVIGRVISDQQPWLRRMALELHRARRFYERPEEAGEYRERPLDGAVSAPLARPEPEFHERCAMAGDHPTLLRTLGLVIDLKVADPDRLRSSRWLSASIVVDGDRRPCRLTRTRCRAVGDDLVTVAETADWVDGMARLGDEERFALLDLEADGTAIKLERFLWTLPRLQEIQAQDAPTNAATPALRANGFTVVRVGDAQDTLERIGRQHDLEQAVGQAQPPTLATEDVTRGVRIEVWDDTAKRWESLHSRLTTIRVVGAGKVLDSSPEEGFIQGTAASESAKAENSPIHVHEAIFGWEGWSLSAPRPGRRVRHENGKEIVEDVPTSTPDPVHPILVVNHVRPGTLPRLRLGRSYAMRAWAVDLAGNSRPHELNPLPAPAAPVAGVLGPSLARLSPNVDASFRLPPELRLATNAVLEARRLATPDAAPAPPPFTSDEHEALVRARLGERIASRAPIAPVSFDRHAAVAEAIAVAIADREQPFVADTAARTADALGPLIASHLASAPGLGLAEAAERALATVTPKRPFLRWDPVPSPAVVPLRRYTEGESVRVLVVRSGVTQDPDTLEITVTSPDEYAAPLGSFGYVAESERHLAPPKTSQVQAELHGMFDDAIGSTKAVDHQKLLGVALLENGSFLDLDIADIDNPPARIAQPGVGLEMQPGAPQAEPITLPLLGPDDPPAPGKGYNLPPGQYVVHDTPDLVLPYLPDPLARGVSFVFQEAGLDRAIPFPFGTEGFTARYRGKWPEIEPFRLVLGGGELAGKVAGRVITVSLPPGDFQRFRLASSLQQDDLDLFGPWRSLPQPVRDNKDVAEAAADGWLWGLTPFEDVVLVHAVPRPLEAPRPTKLLPVRATGSTRVTLAGAVDLHGPSTDHLTAEANWTDPVDDVTLPIWEDRPTTGHAFTSPVLPFEDLALLGPVELDGALPEVGRLHMHAANHELGDTKHRVIDYRFRASTRFPEYFHADLLEPDPNVPDDDGRSVVGPTVSVSVPSSARPAAPVVHSVVPLFRWSDGTEPEQPVARRHGRRAGLRILLERPWFSSGAGELLGILLAPGGDDTFGPPAPDESGFPFVSKWGGDPAWFSAPVDRRPLAPVQLDNLLRTSGLDDRPEPGRPVTPPERLPLASLPDRPMVSVVGYKPQYNRERRLWYVDAAIDPGPTFWPFVRLAVCRYQPDSIAGCHLSPPVRCHYVQLTPERITSVSRTDDRHVRVVVSGPIGVRAIRERGRAGAADAFAEAVSANRQVVAKLQRRDPAIATDLGWRTVAATALVIRGRGRNQYEAAWVGELDAGTVIPLKRPGGNPNWRVAVEEWELLPGDPPSPVEAPPAAVVRPIWERRLIYADEVGL